MLFGGRIPTLIKNCSNRNFPEERNLNSISVAILNFSVETIAFVYNWTLFYGSELMFRIEKYVSVSFILHINLISRLETDFSVKIKVSVEKWVAIEKLPPTEKYF